MGKDDDDDVDVEDDEDAMVTEMIVLVCTVACNTDRCSYD